MENQEMKELISSMKKYIFIDPDRLSYYIIVAIKVILIIIVAKLAVALANRFIGKLFKLSPKFRMDEKKSNTVAGLLKSVTKYVVYIIAAASILNALNILTKPLLAAAGLGGVAIGFGAQSLVRDVFTGFFILFEDQYGVGDYVTIGGMTGTVEDMGLRITKIKAFNGDVYIIPNGEIKTVTNHSRSTSLATIDIGIAYEEDEERAIGVLDEIVNNYYTENPDKIEEKPEVLGIVNFSESEVVIRTVIRTKPLMHWKVEREVRRLIIEAFKQRSIEMPYLKKVLISRDKDDRK